MEPEDPLSCSQQLTTVTYHEPVESSPHPFTLFHIHFNIIPSSMLRSPK